MQNVIHSFEGRAEPIWVRDIYFPQFDLVDDFSQVFSTARQEIVNHPNLLASSEQLPYHGGTNKTTATRHEIDGHGTPPVDDCRRQVARESKTNITGVSTLFLGAACSAPSLLSKLTQFICNLMQWMCQFSTAHTAGQERSS
jgi:hypothetical protein